MKNCLSTEDSQSRQSSEKRWVDRKHSVPSIWIQSSLAILDDWWPVGGFGWLWPWTILTSYWIVWIEFHTPSLKVRIVNPPKDSTELLLICIRDGSAGISVDSVISKVVSAVRIRLLLCDLRQLWGVSIKERLLDNGLAMLVMFHCQSNRFCLFFLQLGFSLQCFSPRLLWNKLSFESANVGFRSLLSNMGL